MNKNRNAVSRMKRVVKSHNFITWPDGYKWKYTAWNGAIIQKQRKVNF